MTTHSSATVPAARGALLAAGATEFAERGFDGARMEQIARRAGCNKALAYRYFGDKEGLFREVLRALVARRTETLEATPAGLSAALAYWYRNTVRSTDFLRLLQREALQEGASEPVEAAERRAYYRRQIDGIRRRQERGEIAPELDPAMLFLMLLALITFPGVLPQICELVAGARPGRRTFDRRWSEMLAGLARRLGPSAIPPSSDGGSP